MSAGDRRGGTSGGPPASCHSRTFGWFQTSCMNRVAASASRGSPRSKDSAKSVRNIDSGGMATSGPRSRISRSIVVPDRSLPTMKKGSGTGRIMPTTTAAAPSAAAGVRDAFDAGGDEGDGEVQQVLDLGGRQRAVAFLQPRLGRPLDGVERGPQRAPGQPRRGGRVPPQPRPRGGGGGGFGPAVELGA